MKPKNEHSNRRRQLRTILLIALVTAAVTGMTACSPYASLDVGVPLKVGPVYVNPSIGVGGYL